MKEYFTTHGTMTWQVILYLRHLVSSALLNDFPNNEKVETNEIIAERYFDGIKGYHRAAQKKVPQLIVRPLRP